MVRIQLPLAAGYGRLTKTTTCSPPSPEVHPDALLDTYFTRFHAKPFQILDESTLRQRLQLDQVPLYLIQAVYAIAARFVPLAAEARLILTWPLGTRLTRAATSPQSG